MYKVILAASISGSLIACSGSRDDSPEDGTSPPDAPAELEVSSDLSDLDAAPSANVFIKSSKASERLDENSLSEEDAGMLALINSKGGEDGFANFIRSSDSGLISDAFASFGLADLADTDEKISSLRESFKYKTLRQLDVEAKLADFVDANGGVEQLVDLVNNGNDNDMEDLLRSLEDHGLSIDLIDEVMSDDVD